MLTILDEYRTYKPSKSTGKQYMDSLSIGIAYGLVSFDGERYMLTEKGHKVVREYTSFGQYKADLEKEREDAKSEKEKDRKVTYTSAILSTAIGAALTAIVTYFLSKC